MGVTSIERRKRALLLNSYRKELERLQRTFDSLNVEVVKDLEEMERLIKRMNVVRKKMVE